MSLTCLSLVSRMSFEPAVCFPALGPRPICFTVLGGFGAFVLHPLLVGWVKIKRGKVKPMVFDVCRVSLVMCRLPLDVRRLPLVARRVSLAPRCLLLMACCVSFVACFCLFICC